MERERETVLSVLHNNQTWATPSDKLQMESNMADLAGNSPLNEGFSGKI